MKQLLEDFKCKEYKELNKEGAFKMMLINICEHRKETYRYWKPTKKGFILITNESYLEFNWIEKDYRCTLDSNIYS